MKESTIIKYNIKYNIKYSNVQKSSVAYIFYLKYFPSLSHNLAISLEALGENTDWGSVATPVLHLFGHKHTGVSTPWPPSPPDS